MLARHKLHGPASVLNGFYLRPVRTVDNGSEHTHTHTQTDTLMRTHKHTLLCIVPILTDDPRRDSTHTHTHTHTHVFSPRGCQHTCQDLQGKSTVNTHTHTHTHTYIHTYTHTHTHTHTRARTPCMTLLVHFAAFSGLQSCAPVR